MKRARTEMLRHHHFSQQVLLAERVAFVVRKMTLEYFMRLRGSTICLRVQGRNYVNAWHRFWFSRSIVNAENTLLNEAEVLIVCVDPLKMKPRALLSLLSRSLSSDPT